MPSILSRLTGDASPAHQLDIDDAVYVIGNERRRRVLDAFEDCEYADVDSLARSIAATEVDGVIDADDRKRVYISLYQTHLPRLAELGALDEVSPGVYERGDLFDAYRGVLEAVRGVLD